VLHHRGRVHTSQTVCRAVSAVRARARRCASPPGPRGHEPDGVPHHRGRVHVSQRTWGAIRATCGQRFLSNEPWGCFSSLDFPRPRGPAGPHARIRASHSVKGVDGGKFRRGGAFFFMSRSISSTDTRHPGVSYRASRPDSPKRGTREANRDTRDDDFSDRSARPSSRARSAGSRASCRPRGSASGCCSRRRSRRAGRP